MNIKHIELVEEAKRFLKENYDMELDIPIKYNTRIKRVLGRFLYKIDRRDGKLTHIPDCIEMGTNFMEICPKEQIIDVLRHELVHYALCRLGKPHSDGQWYFEQELKRLNICRTGTYIINTGLHKYECIYCKQIFRRTKKLSQYAYCKCSQGPNLQYLGIEK